MSVDISVIIPVYNADKYLAAALDDIVRQTQENIEIICINDGSTDNSADILRQYARQDSRIKVVDKANEGAAVARNIGIELAEGKYLSILDADDLFEPDMLERAYVEAERHQAEVVIFDNDRFDSESGRILSKNQYSNAYVPAENPFSSDDVCEHLFTFSFNVSWNMLINRQYVTNHHIRFQNIEQHNDAFFSVCCKLSARRICFIEETLVHYRKNLKASISSGHTGQKNIFPGVMALIAIHDKIIKMPDYDKMLRSFIIYSSNLILFNLNQTRGEDYFNVFQTVKQDWFTRFSPDVICPANYNSQVSYQLCKSIIENDAITHLFLLLDTKMKENQVMSANKQWIFSDPRLKPGNRLVIYGAGDIGTDYYRQLSPNYCVTLIDRAFARYPDRSLPVDSPEILTELEFDWVIIASQMTKSVSQIRENLIKYGISEDKILSPFEKSVYLKGSSYESDCRRHM